MAKGLHSAYAVQCLIHIGADVGQGVAEYRIDFGPGYRIYTGQESDVLIILFGGDTKKGQNADIQLVS